MIDDFYVEDDMWDIVGFELIQRIQSIAKSKGAVQILIICGARDFVKSRFLKSQNLTIASEWFVEDIV